MVRKHRVVEVTEGTVEEIPFTKWEEIIQDCVEEWEQVMSDLLGTPTGDDTTWRARYSPQRAAEALLARRGVGATSPFVAIVALVLDLQFRHHVAVTQDLRNWVEE